MITVAEITAIAGVGERHLERLFKQYIGLSPKFFTRIIRFSTIFQLIEQQDPSWAGLAYETGYFDQSHFIRNFKAFTGEDPSRYGFDEKNMANFFLKKK
jgi:transcriptional regulator GlxA family with amidase domain